MPLPYYDFMYWAVLWKNKQISLKELELVHPEDIVVHWNIATFTTSHPEKIGELAGIIKWGRLIKISSIGPAEIIGTNDSDLGKYLKKQGLTRRFKEVEESRSDDEVISKGKEYIVIGEDREEDDKVLMIEGYQNIGLYENIDFEKPINSMQIGMMPAKLAHMMINIGLANIANTSEVTIYDPFVGLGTTAFLANTLGYDCIASDIDMTAMKQNVNRREGEEFAKKDKRITLFKHDVFEPFKKPFLKNANLIVTEGWLGPIITERSSEKEIFNAQDKIIKLYKAFLTNIMSFYDTITAVFTIPIHTGAQSYVKESIEERCQDHKVEYEFVKEVYKRTGQKVGRQIVIVRK